PHSASPPSPRRRQFAYRGRGQIRRRSPPWRCYKSQSLTAHTRQEVRMHAHDHAGDTHHHHAAGALVRLSPSLYWYRDTCNVYLLTQGDLGLLIDFGSGGILDHLGEAGVREIERVLHTHHHRDQCQGDRLVATRGVSIAVPEREAALFAETDAFWRLKRIYDNYDVSSIGFTLPRSIPVARTLRDYETFAWRGYDVRVLPTPGHTK